MVQDSIRALGARAALSVALMGRQTAVVAALYELAARCGRDDWDGEGARPLEPRAIECAYALIRALPSALPMPEVDAEPDGSVALDWSVARRRRFSVSIGRSGRLAFAWLKGSNSGYGVVQFDRETIPPQILAGIQGVTEHGRASIRDAGAS